MPSGERAKLNPQINEEAAEWLVEFQAGDDDEFSRRAFNAWLRKSPEHIRAYIEMAAIWFDGARLDKERVYNDEELIAVARAQERVVALDVQRTAGREMEQAGPADMSSAGSDVGRRKWMKVAIAASIVSAALVTGLVGWQRGDRQTYAAEIGEQLSFALSDGSVVNLNSRSRVRVQFTESQRTVDLVEGQALFRVAKDSARPFVVRSGATQVRAVGTEFDVYRRKEGTVVTVLEGRVAVTASTAGTRALSRQRSSEPASSGFGQAGTAAARDEILLAAGEQVEIEKSGAGAPTSATAAATAWTQRQLVFESTRLSEVAEEFNRYNKRQLIVRDTHIGARRISGVFSSTDPHSLLIFLREQPHIDIVETADEILISRK